jgi:hypothetical protein
MELWKAIYSTSSLRESMADDLAQLGGVLRCKDCGVEQSMTAQQIAGYLARGWPLHCGMGMRWVTARELAAEANTPDGDGSA